MSKVSHLYQDFSVESRSGRDGDGNAELEEQKLESFEAGYKAGWDDAIKAQEQLRKHISAELGNSLEEVSFTYHELRGALVNELGEVVEGALQRLLPRIAHQAVVAHILEEIRVAGRTHLDRTIELVVAPEAKSTLESVLNDVLKAPFEIVEDPDLGGGQAFLRVGEIEREVNFDQAVEAVSEAFTAFFALHKQEVDQ